LRKKVMNNFSMRPQKFPIIPIMAGLLPSRIAEYALNRATGGSAASVQLIHLEPLNVDHLREIFLDLLQRLEKNKSWPAAEAFLPAVLSMPPVPIPPELLDNFLAQVQALCGGIPRQVHRMLLLGLVVHNIRIATNSPLLWTQNNVEQMKRDLVGIAVWYAENYPTEFVPIPEKLAHVFVEMVFYDIFGFSLDITKPEINRVLAYQAFLPFIQAAVPNKPNLVTIKTAPIFSINVIERVLTKKMGFYVGAIVYGNEAKAGELAIHTALLMRALLPMVVSRASLGTLKAELELHHLMPWLSDTSLPALAVPTNVVHTKAERRDEISKAKMKYFAPKAPGLHLVQPVDQSPCADLFAFLKPESGTPLLIEFQRKTGAQRISKCDLAGELTKSIAWKDLAAPASASVDATTVPVIFVLVADELANDLQPEPDKHVLCFNQGDRLTWKGDAVGVIIPAGLTVIVLSEETARDWLPSIAEPARAFFKEPFCCFA
jgi:hypothetical protein